MTGHVYAVASGKGGVGKTTTVINLGVTLRMADHSVSLVDADLGMANLSTMLGIEHEPTIHDVLAGEVDLDDAIVEEAEGFGIVPGTRALSGFADADPAGLDDIIETLAERYDYVLIDTASGLTREAVQPLVPADGVILVTEPNRAAIGDTKKTVELVELVGGTVLGVVVTKSYEGVDSAGIAATLGTEVLAEIPVDPAVASSLAAEKPLQGHNPDGPAAAAYRQLAKRLSAGPAAATATSGRAGDVAEPEPDDGEAASQAVDEAVEEPADTAASHETEEPAAAGGEAEADEPSIEEGSETETDEPLLEEAAEEIGLEGDGVEESGGDENGDVVDEVEDEAEGLSGDTDEDTAVDEMGGDEVEVDEELDLLTGDNEDEDEEDLDAAVTWGDEEGGEAEDDEDGLEEDEDVMDAPAEVTQTDDGEGESEGEEEEEQRSGGLLARFRRLFR